MFVKNKFPGRVEQKLFKLDAALGDIFRNVLNTDTLSPFRLDFCLLLAAVRIHNSTCLYLPHAGIITFFLIRSFGFATSHLGGLLASMRC